MTHAHSIFRIIVIYGIMVWNSEKNELICFEVLLMEPYQCKARSREQVNFRKKIADVLNLISTKNTFFHVNARAVLERCNLLINRQAEKEKSELKQTGLSSEDTPLDEAIKNIIDRIRECEEEQGNQYNENFQKNKKERKKAEDMTLKAIESLTESKAQKRASSSDDDESPKISKKRRSYWSDTLQYLLEETENDRELKRQELEFQRQEMAMRHGQFQQTEQNS